MDIIAAGELRAKMNARGADGIPFLFVVDFELTEGIFIENPEKQSDVMFHCPLGSNGIGDSGMEWAGGCSLVPHPVGYGEYRRKFDIVTEGLRRGDSFLTNLTVKTPVDTPLSLKSIFLLSRSPYRLYVPGRFVCFSPERFVRIAGGAISSNPMKGTINAGTDNAEAVILSDEKETAEHYTIVDLLRNDLGMVANDIRVERFRYIDRIHTNSREILQVSSEITGKLDGDYLSRIGDIIFRMLPAGSVSGAPKKSTVDIIRKAENEPRGFYTGVFGYFDGRRLDSAVLIRYIEETDGRKYFRSGGGITVRSDAGKEYEEVLEKIYLPFA